MTIHVFPEALLNGAETSCQDIVPNFQCFINMINIGLLTPCCDYQHHRGGLRSERLMTNLLMHLVPRLNFRSTVSVSRRFAYVSHT